MNDVEKVRFGVEPLDIALPDGVLRNSFIVIAGEGGTGKTLLLMAVARRFLESGENVMYFSLDDDPVTIVKQFQLFNININEYVKRELFYIVDGYSFRIIGKREKRHISVIEEVDPHNLSHVVNICIKVLDDLKILNRGLFIIDSINEFLMLYEASRAVELVKNLRASISKARNVVVLASLHTSSKISKGFLKVVEHMVDGIILTKIAIRSSTTATEFTSVRQLLVKKMKGVPHSDSWITYSIERGSIRAIPIAM